MLAPVIRSVVGRGVGPVVGESRVAPRNESGRVGPNGFAWWCRIAVPVVRRCGSARVQPPRYPRSPNSLDRRGLARSGRRTRARSARRRVTRSGHIVAWSHRQPRVPVGVRYTAARICLRAHACARAERAGIGTRTVKLHRTFPKKGRSRPRPTDCRRSAVSRAADRTAVRYVPRPERSRPGSPDPPADRTVGRGRVRSSPPSVAGTAPVPAHSSVRLLSITVPSLVRTVTVVVRPCGRDGSRDQRRLGARDETGVDVDDREDGTRLEHPRERGLAVAAEAVARRDG